MPRPTKNLDANQKDKAKKDEDIFSLYSSHLNELHSMINDVKQLKEEVKKIESTSKQLKEEVKKRVNRQI